MITDRVRLLENGAENEALVLELMEMLKKTKLECAEWTISLQEEKTGFTLVIRDGGRSMRAFIGAAHADSMPTVIKKQFGLLLDKWTFFCPESV